VCRLIYSPTIAEILSKTSLEPNLSKVSIQNGLSYEGSLIIQRFSFFGVRADMR
jgi:hypothetical protein